MGNIVNAAGELNYKRWCANIIIWPVCLQTLFKVSINALNKVPARQNLLLENGKAIAYKYAKIGVLLEYLSTDIKRST